MFNKKNPMRYFSGSTFARLPLYKLAAGGTAVVLTASIGLGAFAASVGPLSAPEPSPTPIVTATPETAATPTPSPTPSPTPEPDKPLTMTTVADTCGESVASASWLMARCVPAGCCGGR